MNAWGLLLLLSHNSLMYQQIYYSLQLVDIFPGMRDKRERSLHVPSLLSRTEKRERNKLYRFSMLSKSLDWAYFLFHFIFNNCKLKTFSLNNPLKQVSNFKALFEPTNSELIVKLIPMKIKKLQSQRMSPGS